MHDSRNSRRRLFILFHSRFIQENTCIERRKNNKESNQYNPSNHYQYNHFESSSIIIMGNKLSLEENMIELRLVSKQMVRGGETIVIGKK